MAASLRIGVAGTGSFTRRVVIPGLKASGVAEVVALYGRTPKRVAETADENGIPSRYESFAEMVNADNVDAVAVCTPNFLHFPMATAALDAGKPVLCEKPLGVSASETLDLVRKANLLGLRTCVNFTYRSMPAFTLARALIESGELGELISGNISYSQASWADPATPLDWRMLARESGGGVLADLGPHVIDLLFWYAGDVAAVAGADSTIVKSRPAREGGSSAPTASDVSAFVCDAGGGRLFSVHLTKLAWGHANQINAMLAGTKGSLRLYHERGQEVTLAVAKAGQHDFQPVAIPLESQVDFAAFPAHHMRLVVRGLTGEGEFATFADGHKTQCVIDAVQRSRQERRWVPIDTRL